MVVTRREERNVVDVVVVVGPVYSWTVALVVVTRRTNVVVVGAVWMYPHGHDDCWDERSIHGNGMEC